jgi:large subunit ribosomal protein L30
MAGKLRVTQTKSTISHIARNRATIRALGLKRIGHTVEIPDNDATRGMVRQVRFLVSVEETGEAARATGDADRAAKKPSEDRGDTPASHRSEDSGTDGQEKTTS